MMLLRLLTFIHFFSVSHIAFAPPSYDQTVANFLQADDRQAIERYMTVYPEMSWLTGKVTGSPDIVQGASGSTLSEQIFGEKHMEFDRTALAVLVVKWVLTGNHDQLTSLQNDSVRLDIQSFDRLQSYTKRIIPNNQAIDAMLSYMAIHDLGKVDAFVEKVRRQTGIQSADHDRVFLEAVRRHPAILPSFNRLDAKYKNMILRGLEAEFSMAQFLQAENVPANLHGLKDLDSDALDFYMLHVLFDIAGVTGHVNTSGSLVMTGPTHNNFERGIEAISGLSRGRSVVEAYDDYLRIQGQGYGLDIANPVERVATRICLMIRMAQDPSQAQRVLKAMKGLDEATLNQLIYEMNKNGVGDGKATLIYYAPAFLSNVVKTFEAEEGDAGFERGLLAGLTILADVYSEARLLLGGKNADGVFTVNVSSLAELGKDHAAILAFRRRDFRLEVTGTDEAKLNIACRAMSSEKICDVLNRCSF